MWDLFCIHVLPSQLTRLYLNRARNFPRNLAYIRICSLRIAKTLRNLLKGIMLQKQLQHIHMSGENHNNNKLDRTRIKLYSCGSFTLRLFSSLVVAHNVICISTTTTILCFAMFCSASFLIFVIVGINIIETTGFEKLHLVKC